MDRNKAIDILRVIAPPRTSKKAFYDFMEARDMAIAALEQQEIIIHCKDCAYHDWAIVDGPYGLAQEIHWCNKFYDKQGKSLAVLPNDFCNWGRRKT